MILFKVTGVDIHSGQMVDRTIQAPSAEEARESAAHLGLQLNSIEAVGPITLPSSAQTQTKRVSARTSRRWMLSTYEKLVLIGGAFAFVLVLLLGIHFLVLRDWWERQHREEITRLIAEADALTSEGRLSAAKAKYMSLWRLLADRVIRGSDLQETVSTAKIAEAALDAKLRERQKKLDRELLTADAKRDPQASFHGAGLPRAPAVDKVNYALVDTLRKAWQREGMQHETRERQIQAIVLMQQVVEMDCKDPQVREATLDYISKNIDSW